MFSFMRYCWVQLINGVGQLAVNLSLLMTSEVPPKITGPTNIDDDKNNSLDMSSLISEDESQVNESVLEEDIIDTPPKLDSTSPETLIKDSSYPDLHYIDVSLKSHFNDTLEEVEYMMEQGRKLINKTEPTTPKVVKKAPLTVNYDNVKSPISMYINYSPLTPLRRNNFMPRRVRLETLGESTSLICDDANENNEMQTVENEKSHTFPKRAYISSGRKVNIYENVQTVRKDGAKMQKMFGSLKKSPTVIKHYGRLRSNLSQRKENIPIDDSFQGFLMDCGDISVHVVKHANRN